MEIRGEVVMLVRCVELNVNGNRPLTGRHGRAEHSQFSGDPSRR